MDRFKLMEKSIAFKNSNSKAVISEFEIPATLATILRKFLLRESSKNF